MGVPVLKLNAVRGCDVPPHGDCRTTKKGHSCLHTKSGHSSRTYPDLLRSNTDRGGQRGRQRIKHARGSLHGDNVAIWAQAADDALDRARQLRMPMKLVAGMDVGDVDLDDGSVERLERIINRNGRERVAGRIDDDGSVLWRAD